MARPSEKDPLDKFRFTVKVEGFQRVGFTQCDTPSISYSTKSYAEGGAHFFPKKIIDSADYKPISLSRGVSTDLDFNNWARQVIELVRGKTQSQENPLDYRRDVVIEHRNRAGQIVKKYILYNAVPVEFKPASDFQSDGDDVLSMETLTLAYEGFEIQSISTDSNPKDITDIVKRTIRRL
jgi:phage tail-like protein